MMNPPIVDDFAAIAASLKATYTPDAELIRVCHKYAEEELAFWYRGLAVEGCVEEEWHYDGDRYDWIANTPATSLEGWRAKALVIASLDCTAYFNDQYPMNTPYAGILASLLQDLVAPARSAIIAKLAATYGPLPDDYTPEGRLLGASTEAEAKCETSTETEAVCDTPSVAEPIAVDSRENVEALWQLLSGFVSVAGKQCAAAGYPPPSISIR